MGSARTSALPAWRASRQGTPTIRGNGWSFARDWVMSYEYGVDSPCRQDGIDGQESWCQIVDSAALPGVLAPSMSPPSEPTAGGGPSTAPCGSDRRAPAQ